MDALRLQIPRRHLHLGPLLRGRWYETTAIPEIRDQVAALARHLLTTQAHASPGSAA